MSIQLLKQFSREAEAWKRLLEFIQSENAYIKTRIAEIAGHDIPKELLPEVENFQSRSIEKDEILDIARRYVGDYQNMINRESSLNRSGKILQAQKNLQKYIETLEQNFNKLKTDFNEYLAEKL